MSHRSAYAKVLNACLDDERTLEHESRLVDEESGGTLARLARQRESFIDVAKLAPATKESGPPHPRRSLRSTAREIFRSIRVELWGKNRGDSMAECRRANARARDSLEKALDLSWSAEILDLMLSELTNVRRERTELYRLEWDGACSGRG